jgi:Na+-driven multidrug efflux pump
LFSILLLAFGDVFIGFFIDAGEADLITLSKGFIAILWPIFVFNGLNVMVAAYLTAIHRPSPSAVVAILRALVFPLGLLYLITEFFPEIPFLAAITAGEMLTLFITVSLFMTYRPGKVINNPVTNL